MISIKFEFIYLLIVEICRFFDVVNRGNSGDRKFYLNLFKTQNSVFFCQVFSPELSFDWRSLNVTLPVFGTESENYDMNYDYDGSRQNY